MDANIEVLGRLMYGIGMGTRKEFGMLGTYLYENKRGSNRIHITSYTIKKTRFDLYMRYETSSCESASRTPKAETNTLPPIKPKMT
jgi:hypothetical protein